jgi:hypothetical protein
MMKYKFDVLRFQIAERISYTEENFFINDMQLWILVVVLILFFKWLNHKMKNSLQLIRFNSNLK